MIHDKFKRVPQNIKPGSHHSTSGLSNILVCIESNPTVYAACDSVVDTVDVGTGCWIRFVIYDNLFNDFVDIWNAMSSLVRYRSPAEMRPITFRLKRKHPHGVTKVVSFMDDSSRGTCQYPRRESTVVKQFIQGGQRATTSRGTLTG